MRCPGGSKACFVNRPTGDNMARRGSDAVRQRRWNPGRTENRKPIKRIGGRSRTQIPARKSKWQRFPQGALQYDYTQKKNYLLQTQPICRRILAGRRSSARPGQANPTFHSKFARISRGHCGVCKCQTWLIALKACEDRLKVSVLNRELLFETNII